MWEHLKSSIQRRAQRCQCISPPTCILTRITVLTRFMSGLRVRIVVRRVRRLFLNIEDSRFQRHGQHRRHSQRSKRTEAYDLYQRRRHDADGNCERYHRSGDIFSRRIGYTQQYRLQFVPSSHHWHAYNGYTADDCWELYAFGN